MTTARSMVVLATLFLTALSPNLFAQISVNRSVIEFSAGKTIQDVEILNTGKHKIYLDMKISKIENPESDDPVRTELTDPRTAAVLVSPKQLLVLPGQRKRVRLIQRQEAQRVDNVYRLSIKPYAGKLKLGAANSEDKQSAVKVLVGYDLLLLSRPKNLNPDLQVTRNQQSIVFRNNGNTNVLIRKIQQCNQAKTDCVELQPNRLYAGEQYTVALPKSGSAAQYPIEVWQSVVLENSYTVY